MRVSRLVTVSSRRRVTVLVRCFVTVPGITVVMVMRLIVVVAMVMSV